MPAAEAAHRIFVRRDSVWYSVVTMEEVGNGGRRSTGITLHNTARSQFMVGKFRREYKRLRRAETDTDWHDSGGAPA